MNISLQLVIPILLPLISGLLIGFCRPLREPRLHRIFLIAALALNAAIVLMIAIQGDMRLELFRLTERLPVLFKTDDLARLFSVLASLMFLLVGIYSPTYMRHEGNETRFHMFYFLALAMLMGVGYAGNLLTLYVFFEMMSLLAAPMVLHSMSKVAIAAAFKFIYYSIAGASLVLVGFFFIYTYGTGIEFTAGGVLDMMKLAGNEGRMLAGTMLAIVGFGSKAGMFPLHAWLPTAHPVAPAPASAILSGIITKAGVIAVIRFVFCLVCPDFIRGTWVQTAWISFALFSVLLGSLLAFREPELKRRFAYSSISQVSYIMFGLATLTAASFAGAVLHMVVHSLVKDALFLVAGAVIIKTGITEVADLRGIGRKMPVTLWCFTLLAITAVGMPPTGGFISKWFLATGSLAADTGFFSWLGPAVLLLGAMLSAGYLFPISISGFFPGADYDNNAVQQEVRRDMANLSMLLPIVLLTAAAVILGMFPGGMLSFIKGLQ